MAEVVTWTAGFVFLTLVINASILPWVLSMTGLNTGEPADPFRGLSLLAWLGMQECTCTHTADQFGHASGQIAKKG